MAEEFLKAGSTVIVTGRRESVLRDAQEKFPAIHTHVGDVGSVEDRERLARWVVQDFPGLNVLVSCSFSRCW